MDDKKGLQEVHLLFDLPEKFKKILVREAGGHRVQRIPPHDKTGRVHSSTATVAVIVEQETFHPALKRENKDFEISFFSGTGPGGQHRNKTQNSARIKHLPTGLVRQAQTRSRENSVRVAMEALNIDLDKLLLSSNKKNENFIRSNQVGSGERGDKIRTYRFQDDVVINHIDGKKVNLKKLMKGNLEILND